MSETVLEIETLGETELGPCDCCGQITHRVWGWAHVRSGNTVAAYYVEWIPGAVREHGAMFDLIVGAWGDGATDADRTAVTLAFRHTERGPEFMAVDAGDRPHARSALVTAALNRDAFLSSGLGPRAYAVVDAVWIGDARVAELVVPGG